MSEPSATTTDVTAATVRQRVLSRFEALLAKASRIFKQRDAAYAGTKIPLANIRASERIGIPPSVACYIRMTDKYNRMETLIKTGLVCGAVGEEEESILDNAFDLAVYALIFMILREEEIGEGRAEVVNGFDGLSGAAVTVSLSEDAVKTVTNLANVNPWMPPGPNLGPIPAWMKEPQVTVVDGTGRAIKSTDLAASLYQQYIESFNIRPAPMPYADIDPVTQAAWIRTAHWVMARFKIA